MRAVLQRVTRATCTVEGRVTGQTGPGFLILLGVAPEDTPEIAHRLAAKIVKLRVFNDEAGKMNLSVQDIGGGILSVSQFTLYADTRRGNRPGFSGAAAPDHARALYAEFNAALRACGLPVGEGVFGAHMTLDLTNDGPVTLILDTAEG
ncbi:D-tyrosyl-tRNA(Tyr) deacylase [Deinococcus metallilatus]|uniref:D-aminoacyl-tRNA deacylase n=1 Tax=Deinococcus metallilatus TaxID=1211322 RepID=A0AAJ5F5J3_9DEIO|nr:D-aminoacyl-tRNA deacylase [Deinococcus metallilatus]MBB5295339.1 D-tyrosyl-tRNA(Tyr) deacylase [Deinococcus metallilatus]QBY08508.1 D-tyrosyl-tRNA(Tyr) deacylase [Deinococcus metallilatus]RXJ11018.1 D-tyrosyl-tRNA(Tyr) deacylase [Deinococcus metallilatus]TLK21604.1 D-tyrosyl-tRNA(Tyr) deacylase [Deinococcus metallilatus]GMA15114.1 D-aminoacyl-tRNA deacylase [Deinococcus metallilatus]